MPRGRRVPSYRLHRPSGQAVVTLSGRDRYLGPHGSEVSRAEYDRLVMEWLSHGRRAEPEPGSPTLTVNELLLAYWEHLDGYYVKGGKHTSEWFLMRTALRVVRRLYGHTPAEAFGPKALKACRQDFIARGLCRGSVNHDVLRIKRMFRWTRRMASSPKALGPHPPQGLRFVDWATPEEAAIGILNRHLGTL